MLDERNLELMDSTDIVFIGRQCIGTHQRPKPFLDFDANVISTMNVLEGAASETHWQGGKPL